MRKAIVVLSFLGMLFQSVHAQPWTDPNQVITPKCNTGGAATIIVPTPQNCIPAQPVIQQPIYQPVETGKAVPIKKRHIRGLW